MSHLDLAMPVTGAGYLDGLFYLHSDHLGSNRLTTDANGQVVSYPASRTGYYPYGDQRYGQPPTDYRYTGQYHDEGTDLSYYGARYYDGALGRFISPDTIVPSPGDPQSLNRYTYVRNNPLGFVDPSGNVECASGDHACWENEWYWKDLWYKEHGYENTGERYIYTGNYVIDNAAALLRDDDLRRRKILGFARDLRRNGTTAGEALARVTAYAAAFYKSVGAAINPLSVPRFVDDVSNVLTGMAGLNILVDFFTGAEESNPYFVKQNGFPDTDLKAIFQDRTGNQPYHFWFYVAVSFWNGPEAAQAGNMFHEIDPTRTGGRSFQDFALGAMGVDLGQRLRSGALSIYGVSDWIRSTLMR